MKKLGKSAPESVFLENDAVISPKDMHDCIIGRTQGVLDLILDYLECKDAEMSKDQLRCLLWQVEGNLRELRKVTDVWSEVERKMYQGRQELVSLHCVIPASYNSKL